MYIPRHYHKLENYVKPNKVLTILGARQTGKTTLLREYLATCPDKYKFDTGDNILTQEIISQHNLSMLKDYASGYELLVIDEAQRIPNIGLSLKLLIDHIPSLKIIVAGSSSFELAGQIGEPLTGRKITLTLFPIAQLELSALYNPTELQAQLEKRLIFGSYPEIVAFDDMAANRQRITEIVSTYLLKDIMALDSIKNPKILLALLRLLAFQIGSEVSLSELSQKLAINYKTVARYIGLLEKSFIIYTLRGFSRNLRKEMNKKCKYYFYDNGIRNALIANFNSINCRDDVGMLWENFLIMERLKKRAYQEIHANDYFWRTWDKKEIDLIEEREGKLFGYEVKWNNKSVAAPKEWVDAYPNGKFHLITKDNFLTFIS